MVPAYTAAAFVKRLLRLALAAPPAGALLALAFAHNIVRRHPATMQLLHRPPAGGLAAVGAAPSAGAVAPRAAQPQPLLPLPPQVTGGAAQQQANGHAADDSDVEDAEGQQQAAAEQAEQQQAAVWRGEDVYDFAEPDPAASRALESCLWELEALRRHANPQVRCAALRAGVCCAVLCSGSGSARAACAAGEQAQRRAAPRRRVPSHPHTPRACPNPTPTLDRWPPTAGTWTRT